MGRAGAIAILAIGALLLVGSFTAWAMMDFDPEALTLEGRPSGRAGLASFMVTGALGSIIGVWLLLRGRPQADAEP